MSSGLVWSQFDNSHIYIYMLWEQSVLIVTQAWKMSSRLVVWSQFYNSHIYIYMLWEQVCVNCYSGLKNV